MNKQGGIDPSNKDEMERAQANDLITLPVDVAGTNCFNCQFVVRQKHNLGFCNNPKVQQSVNNRNCCALWSSKGTRRPWEKS